MKFFNVPFENDKENLVALSELNENSAIKNDLICFTERYDEYHRARGCVLYINGMVGLGKARERINTLYKSKNKNLDYINLMRMKYTGKCCVMCGAILSTQVDHFLPQGHFPEFSILSANLIPVCKCNQKKKNFTIGCSADEILLHPRYEKKLSKRIIKAKIRDHNDNVTIEISFITPRGLKRKEKFDFHFKKIVDVELLKTMIIEKFNEMKCSPSSVVYSLAEPIPSKNKLKSILFFHLRSLDKKHRSQNNWESVFIHALLERKTLNWIWRKLSIPNRKHDAPL